MNNSVPKPQTPDEPKIEDILGTAPQRGAGRGDLGQGQLRRRSPRSISPTPRARSRPISSSRAATSSDAAATVVARAEAARASSGARLRGEPVAAARAGDDRAGARSPPTRCSTASVRACARTATGATSARPGCDNYPVVYTDHVFWQAICGTTALFVFFAVAIETLLGLALALLVARELRFAGFLRVIADPADDHRAGGRGRHLAADLRVGHRRRRTRCSSLLGLGRRPMCWPTRRARSSAWSWSMSGSGRRCCS